MPDRIHIHDLTVGCIVGINPEERVSRQNVTINVMIEADLSAAAVSDRIEDTLDYRALKHRIVDMVEESRFLLVERLAGAIADLCLQDGRAAAVTVKVEKPGALTRARSVGVELRRERR